MGLGSLDETEFHHKTLRTRGVFVLTDFFGHSALNGSFDFQNNQPLVAEHILFAAL